MTIYCGTKWFYKRIKYSFVFFHLFNDLFIILYNIIIFLIFDWVNHHIRCINSCIFSYFWFTSLCFYDSWDYYSLSCHNFTYRILFKLTYYLSWYSSIRINLLCFYSLNKTCFHFIFNWNKSFWFTLFFLFTSTISRCWIITIFKKV